MVTALCFITVEPRHVNDVGSEIARIPQVRTVYSVTGQLDIVAIIEVSDVEAVATVVTDGISAIAGVSTTETHIAFRTYRPEDLGAGFSLGY
ncbi:MAG: Lrp/AsnC ligand binding domain-containing protein [Actinobacteria bacterium]|mgnify:FL=1|jgi:DNA-binding Lrp family transcriptional regulator|nr:Lrp/AsnC ligand binding domain-containing protein [Actinomycetota bacterium]